MPDDKDKILSRARAIAEARGCSLADAVREAEAEAAAVVRVLNPAALWDANANIAGAAMRIVAMGGVDALTRPQMRAAAKVSDHLWRRHAPEIIDMARALVRPEDGAA